jgi:hypothetical protein
MNYNQQETKQINSHSFWIMLGECESKAETNNDAGVIYI